MKRVAVLLALLAFALTSCQAKFDLPWLKKVSDGPEAASRIVKVEAFDTIRLEGQANLVLDSTVAADEVQIASDNGKANALNAKLEGRTLILTTADGMALGGKQEFRVNPVPGLTKLQWTGVGTAKFAQPWKGKALALELEGLGSLDAEVEAEELSLVQKGAGQIVVTGSATVLHVRSSGLGQVDASELVSKTATVESSGVGEVLVNATESLQVDASGMGAVKYAGDPKTKNLRSSGVTSIEAFEPGQ